SQERNTISVCVHGDQTVISGQSVRLRLLEPMRVGRHELPRNSLITGDCRIQGERLDITISQVEYSGNIIPVELAVYDNDGQPGIFIPGSMEANAVKEMAANMGQNLGTTISITNQSAGNQLLSELGKGAIQGVSQYISKKMRQEKVRLKSGHALMLYQKQ
ncbi:conjugative transposon protein TraM, partial [Duncaniella muris]|uniref:conjugative transposon protein TraM n=2 Tax=Bacteroidales TaxID=171549 RepID=UPI0025B404E9